MHDPEMFTERKHLKFAGEPISAQFLSAFSRSYEKPSCAGFSCGMAGGASTSPPCSFTGSMSPS
jgi:hypothetical protein